MRIGIVGATGFLGLNLAAHFGGISDYRVVATSRRSNPPVPKEIDANWMQLNLSDPIQVSEFLDQVDSVLYLAHEGLPTSEGDWKTEVENNLSPFLNLLEQVKFQKRYRPLQIIYLSSGGAIYGNSKNLVPWKETDEATPSTTYGILKLSAEHHLRHAVEQGICSGLCLRVANPYGNRFAHLKDQGIIDVAVSKILSNQNLKLFAEKDFVRDFIYMDDFNRALEAAVRLNCKFEIINIGSGIGTRLDTVLAEVQNSFKKVLNIQLTTPALNSNAISWSVLNISKAETILKWRPIVPLRDGIARIAKAQTDRQLF